MKNLNKLKHADKVIEKVEKCFPRKYLRRERENERERERERETYHRRKAPNHII